MEEEMVLTLGEQPYIEHIVIPNARVDDQERRPNGQIVQNQQDNDIIVNQNTSSQNREQQVKTPRTRLKILIFVILTILISLSIGTYFLVKMVEARKPNLIEFNFIKNASYDYNLTRLTTYIKDGRESASETLYFLKLLCQDTYPNHFDQL